MHVLFWMMHDMCADGVIGAPDRAVGVVSPRWIVMLRRYTSVRMMPTYPDSFKHTAWSLQGRFSCENVFQRGGETLPDGVWVCERGIFWPLPSYVEAPTHLRTGEGGLCHRSTLSHWVCFGGTLSQILAHCMCAVRASSLLRRCPADASGVQALPCWKSAWR